MSDWDDVPRFGSAPEGVESAVRPSAYAIVSRPDGRILVVRTPRGLLFLPGGGLEPGESPREAAVRETREECGLVIELAGEIFRAIDVVHAPAEQAWFEKRSVFFRARSVNTIDGEGDEASEALWLEPDEATARLAHEGHRQAIVRWRRENIPTSP